MNILYALGIREDKKSMISLVGGGGKTTLMFRLAKELKHMKRKVLATTTTAIFYPGQAQYDRLFLLYENNVSIEDIEFIQEGSITVIGRYITEENKLKGVPPEYINGLYSQGNFDNIIVEADGAKTKPIKAPDGHEPVIPVCTTHLVGVIGFDSYLKELGAEWVHRPQLLASITGRNPGDIIDDDVIVKLVLSSNGLFKSCPETACKILFINKVDNNLQHEAAQRIGRSILKISRDIDKVVIGSLQSYYPVTTVFEQEM